MHEYKAACQCFRCKGIRNSNSFKLKNFRRKAMKDLQVTHKADLETQHARYIDCGPSNWDDRESPSGDY